jgi:hypothetical protein
MPVRSYRRRGFCNSLKQNEFKKQSQSKTKVNDIIPQLLRQCHNIYNNYSWFLIFWHMKRIMSIIPFMFCFGICFSQGFQVQLLAGFGATIVDVKKITGDAQTIYNTYSYEFMLQGLIRSKHHKFRWMPEVGMHRLYYYNSSSLSRSRTVWTAHAGFGIERAIFNYCYFQTGANVRYFLDGSGIRPGLMGGVGFKIPVSKKIMIPLGVRLDIVCSKAMPSSFCVCTGLQFGKRER